MRAVFIGASSLAVMTARFLLRRRHEVVIIERNKERIEALAGELDCGFLLGDGSKPALLREADPAHTDFLFCLTGNDQANILASLVGRSLGFPRIVTKIDDPEFEHICIELGLEDMIIPSRTIGRYLADLFQGMNLLDLSGVIKDEARIFTFVVRHDDEMPVADLKLPAHSRVVCLYRGGKFVPLEDDSRLHEDDEVVLITHADNLPELHERWGVQMETVRKH
ncbi:MAG: TrkA family potassium uptake protein [Pseudomonadota bacterium]